jgi:DDE superfamily endonuclease
MVLNLDPFDVDDTGYHHVVGNGKDCITGEAISEFIRRNQNVADFPFVSVTPVPIETLRYHKIDPYEVTRFFKTWKKEAIDMGYKDYQIINWDEIGLGGAGAAKKTAKRVVTTKNFVEQNIPAVRTLNMKTGLLTLIPFVTAAGRALPSWVIHRGESSSSKMIEVAAGGNFRLIPNGATTKVNKYIFRKHLVASLDDYRKSLKMPALPLILLCDGDISRKDSELMKILKDANIKLILLPAHATHILQPIDVSLAKRIKRGYVQTARKSTRGMV